MKWLSLLLLFLMVGLNLLGEDVRVLIGQGDGVVFVANKGLVDVREVQEDICFGDGQSLVYYQNRPYRGRICVVKSGENVLVVNVLDIEDYVKGVLYNEISHYWPIEAIKAQAVVSRTYALYRALSSGGEGIFDLKDDQSSQVYRGYNSERFRTNKAVDETKGEILVCSDTNRVFPAFYHACCGGETELPQDVWSGTKFGCAFEVVRDPFCSISPYRSWKYEISFSNFIFSLHRLGVRGKEVKYISISESTHSGRTKSILLITDKGQYVLSAQDVRISLGPSKLKSTLFKVQIQNNKVVFDGHGWGHGVGMCQWGAYGMALKGYNYREILKFYYPNANISNISSVLVSLGLVKKK